MKRKILSIVTVLAMLTTLVSPASVFADGGGSEITPTGIVSDQYSPDTETGYLAFTSDGEFSMSLQGFDEQWDGVLPWEGSIEYTTSRPTESTIWKEWNGYSVTAGAKEGQYALYFRGTGNTKLSSAYWDDSNCQYGARWTIDSSEGVACSGNLETLLDYETVLAGDHPEMDEHCCDYMFCDCDALTSLPDMPATELSESCYEYMFCDCDSITEVPDICYDEIPDYALYRMFYACGGIESVGDITVGHANVYSMAATFLGCRIG